MRIVGMYWVTMLDRSTPGAEGEPRSFNSDVVFHEWFGGNVTMTALRILAKCIYRASKDDELDIYDFKEGFEAHVRDWVIRLRQGHLASRQIETLIEYRKKVLADEKRTAKFAGLSDADKKSIEASEKNETLQSRLTELGTLALKVQKYGAEELKKSPADIKDFLANKGIIPADRFPTPAEIAARMTPGDAKALVQSLMTQYQTDPSRLPVFKVLYQTTKAVVEKLNATREAAKKTA